MRDKCTHKESREKSSRERDKGNVLKDKGEKRLQREMGVREGGERQRHKDGVKAGTDRSETIHFR